jgi:choline dehydrogenase-like flavoprotein
VGATGVAHGVDGLTVADASIIRQCRRAFTHLVTIALAEKIAEQPSSALWGGG